MPAFCTCNWLCPGKWRSTCFAYTNRWLGGQLPDLSMRKTQELVENTLFASLYRQYSCGQGWLAIPALRTPCWEYRCSAWDALMCFLPVDSLLLSLPSHFSAAIYFLFEVRAVAYNSPLPQQQQLKPASPMLQQGTALRCWRDVYSRGEQWVERSDAFWSEVDSNIGWGTACWTADVPSPQCKSLFSSGVLLVGCILSPKPHFHFKTSHSLHPVGKPWPPGLQPGLKWAALISGIRAGALYKAKAAFTTAGRQQGSQTGDPGVLPAIHYGCGVSWTCASCAWDLHYVLTCKYWFIPVPELPYQMTPNHAEMSGSFAM